MPPKQPPWRVGRKVQTIPQLAAWCRHLDPVKGISWPAIASGIDPTAFQDAMDDPRSMALVTEDVRLGAQGRFRGPPAIFVNDRHVPRYKLEGHDILGEIVEQARQGE